MRGGAIPHTLNKGVKWMFEKVREEFKDNLLFYTTEAFKFAKREGNDYRVIFRFKNGYGASLINGFTSYGNEIAVIYFPSEELTSARQFL